MTLSPVFRSPEAVRVLESEGVWSRLAPAASGQARAIANVKADLPRLLDPGHLDIEALAASASAATLHDGVEVTFVQEFFFLILFRAVLQTIGVAGAGLDLCAELNFCIKGTITSADNLFDDQDKALLPLKVGEGARFRSILQLLIFERLMTGALDRGVRAGCISTVSAQQFQAELLTRMAAIGSLEGSEERGVEGVLEPDQMLNQVHRVRGGALFELAFIAPRLVEPSVDPRLLSRAQAAISKLGTAFQIVDDLTDFEFDLARGRHNLLVAQITHCGTPPEQSRLKALPQGAGATGDLVSGLFGDSARAVVLRGEREARAGLDELQSLGFWFPPHLGDQLLRAIVGADGVERMRVL
jgi:hypothetical protein